MTGRQLKILFIAALLSAAAFTPISCSKPEPGPAEEDFTILAKIISPLSVKPGAEVTFSVYSSKGPKTTDVVVLKNIKTYKETECTIVRADESEFTFVISDKLESGSFSFGIRRGSVTKNIGNVDITVEREDPIDPGDPVQPAEGSSVYGLVSCGGKPIANVAVTDGYLVTVTGSDGVYQLASAKKNGMVYISTPSGYTAPCIGVQAKFYKYTRYSSETVERVDFELEETGDQTNHTMLFFGDMHLADRNNDRAQFRVFTDDVSAYMKAHPSEKIYAMTLGDMTWDCYWYSNSYQFENYLEDINRILNLTVYHSMGNHDHNMQTNVQGNSEGWGAVNWDTERRFRGAMGPNYYSFNVGRIHYISLDDIFCKNTTGGTSSDRHYTEEVISEELTWLEEDLKHVDKATPVFVTMHAPVFTQSGDNSLANASTLLGAFEGFSSVTFVTGHTHKMYNVDKGKIKELNSGAVCATWWWSGATYQALNTAQDGALGGYRIMDVKGTRTSSYYKCSGRDASYQFRTYDRNSIQIVPENYGVTNETNAAAFRKALENYGGYGSSSKANYVYINVWDYDTGWKIEVTEDGKPLTVTRQSFYDPLFIITYSAPRYIKTDSPTWGPYKTNHMFRVTASSATSTLEIKVTDDEGREYKESMSRPKAFTIDTYK